MKPVILLRPADASPEEHQAIKRRLPCVTRRSAVPPGSTVIGRYSVLPFYKELEDDLAASGSHLVNSPFEHAQLLDMRNWVEPLEGMTPKTWYRLEDIPDDEPGPFVVKGCTYSKKHAWSTHMFAESREKAADVVWKLQCDGLIGGDRIYLRKYVPLKAYGTGLNGLPISDEYRLFFLRGEIMAAGFYWTGYEDLLPGKVIPAVPDAVKRFAHRVWSKLHRAGVRAPFLVMDVATTASGEPILIELNEGQMSGLGNCDPKELYRNIRRLFAGYEGQQDEDG